MMGIAGQKADHPHAKLTGDGIPISHVKEHRTDRHLNRTTGFWGAESAPFASKNPEDTCTTLTRPDDEWRRAAFQIPAKPPQRYGFKARPAEPFWSPPSAAAARASPHGCKDGAWRLPQVQ